MKLLSLYRKLLSLPMFGSTVIAAGASSLQLGIFPIALLLGVAHDRGFGHGAAVVSVSALAGATLPLRGRLIDRYNYTLVMSPALVVYLAALTTLVLNERNHGPFVTTMVSALVAGMSAPPIQIVTRLRWRELVTSELQTTALTLHTVLVDVGFIVGPSAAAFLVVMVAPWAGLAVSALLTTSTTLLLSVRQVPHQYTQPRSAELHWPSLLCNRVMCAMIAAAVLFFLAVRVIELALSAWAQQHNAPLLSGVLLTCMSVGSVAGGLALGALPTKSSAQVTVPAALAVLSMGTLLVTVASFTRAGVLVAATTLMGVALGPSFTAMYAAANSMSPADRSAETLSWLVSFMSLGGAVGAAVAGTVIPEFGPGALLAIAAVSLVVASMLGRLAAKGEPVVSGRVHGHRHPSRRR